jgi:anti-sigma regulatory factor (Ser/Thr protein kinase)
MAADLNSALVPASLTISITSPAEIATTGEAAGKFVAKLGFSSSDCKEIAIVATELASNLLKHAEKGSIVFTALQAGERIGVQVESKDSGPGIPDAEQALVDGYSTAGSLGIGLGTVNRLMDELMINPGMPNGTSVVCRRWLRLPGGPLFGQKLEVGAATRSYKQQPENGDALVIRQWEDNALLGVIDGLGHGQFAQKAAQAARHYVDKHFDQDLKHLFRGAARACSATRGVVMALAHFTLSRRTFSVASVGNVEVVAIDGPQMTRIMPRRGVVGFNAPPPLLEERPWNQDSVLVMHTDGLKSRWHPDDFPGFRTDAPDVLARRLLTTLGKMEDDATVLIARNAN